MASLTFTKATAQDRLKSDAYDLRRALKGVIEHLNHDAERLEGGHTIQADVTFNYLQTYQRALLAYEKSRAAHATVNQIGDEG